MNRADENIRDAITDGLTRASIDARNLAVEVRDGSVSIKGMVPTEEQRRRLAKVVDATVIGIPQPLIEVNVLPVAPIDSEDGRGRSPVTGTSADSAHESRHQVDRD